MKQQVFRACEWCGRDFSALPWLVAKGGGRFCSPACKYAAARRSVERVCEHCGATFLTRPSKVARGHARFCSEQCFHAALLRRVERVCEHCGATFVVKPYRAAAGQGLYCRRACYNAARAAAPLAPLAERFWARVDTAGPVPPHRREFGPCWVWTGRIGGGGYGYVSTKPAPAVKTRLRVHRVAWDLAAGAIPDGLEVCHVCDNRRCVRNDEPGTYEVAGIRYPRRGHLFLAPRAANTADMAAKGRGYTGGAGDGEDNPRAKLREADVLNIRARYAAGGVSQRALAREYGVDQATIGAVVREETWRHLSW